LREERDSGDEPNARDAHQSPRPGRVDRELGDVTLDLSDLASEKIDLAKRRIDCVALVFGQHLGREPFASGDAERVTHRRALLEVAM
jgi:hypothetical protein